MIVNVSESILRIGIETDYVAGSWILTNFIYVLLQLKFIKIEMNGSITPS